MWEELQECIERARAEVGPAVVSIGRNSRGCGVVVGPGRVVTNAHNLHGDTTKVTFADGRVETGRLQGADPDTDLAVIAVDTATVQAPSWAEIAPAPGQPVFALSLSSSGTTRVTFGTVSAVDRAFRGPRGRRISGSIEHTAPLPRGSSGSAVVDPAGRLVGISTHRLGEGFYLALPAAADLRIRIDALGRGEVPKRPRLGVGLAPLGAARQLRRAVGLPEQDGLLVRLVEDDSAAGHADIRVGDLLTAIAGRPVRTHDDLYDALDRHPAGQVLAVGLVRGAEEVEVSVTFDEPAQSG